MGQRWIWEPDPSQIGKTNVWSFLTSLGYLSLQEFLAYSRDENEDFWRRIVERTGIEWFRPYDRVLDLSRGPEWAEWFVNGRLNIAWNCLERHARGDKAAHIACLWEGEDGSTRQISFAELETETGRVANALASMGLEKGDRVALIVPMVPEILSILYACAKLGLVAVPIFAGYGTGAMASRLEDSGARLVFTADALERRGRKIPLKERVDEALRHAPGVERLVMLEYKVIDVPWNSGRDIRWSNFLAGQPPAFSSLPLDSNTPVLILYTSGTTGRPKGTVHTHAGCLAQMTKEIYLAFDHQPDDRFFWLSDIGWMMGAWEIIGNHNFGGTILLYDGAPDYPGPDRLWQIIIRHRVTTFGISPTAIRVVMAQPVSVPEMPSLRLLGSTGEPWDDTSYLWYFEKVGRSRCPIINISGGSEIVGCFLFPLPVQPLKPCTLGQQAPGMATEVFDEEGRPVRGRKGYLVCTKPAPSMTRGIWGDPERYLETYWSRWKGVWYHGDWASVDEDGCWFLHGRADESLKIAGRKVGPAEVEEALMEHPAVVEAAVIGVPDSRTGEALVAFVVLSADAHAGAGTLASIESHLVTAQGSAFRPRKIMAVRELPKTQSGKLVRRLMRQAYLGEELGDLTTVANPESLDGFRCEG